MPSRHVPVLDGLRALAVLLVLATHVPTKGMTDTPLIHALLELSDAGGYFGVDIFFVLSGFLITRILVAEEKLDLRRFMIRRFLRIFPIYYLYLFCVALVYPKTELLFAVFYLTNYIKLFHPITIPIGHLWSLAVEEHFYLFWPLVVSRLGREGAARAMYWVILPGAALVSLALVLLHVPHAAPLIYGGTQTRIASLGLGCVVALNETAVRTWRPGQPVAAWYAAIAAAFAIGSVVLGKLGAGQLGFVTCWAIVSLMTLLIALRAQDHGWGIARHLSRGVMPAIGRVSYGIYLYHPVVFIGVDKLVGMALDPSWLRFAVVGLLGSAAAWGVAELSFLVIEGPIGRWKERIAP